MTSSYALGFTAPAVGLTAQTSAWNGVQTLSSTSRPSVTHHVSRKKATINMAFTSIGGILTPAPVSLPEDMNVVITAIYKQVFGNAHIMESEREEVSTLESEFRLSKDIREFIRGLANSETYKERFFYNVSQYRFIELIFKHLLGRAPDSKKEYQDAMKQYHTKGYSACINYFMDSLEYEESFGFNYVPYGIYKGCYPINEGFNRSVAMRLTPSSSDKARSTMLQYCVLANCSPNWLSIAKALPSGTEKGTGLNVGGRYTSSPQGNDNSTPAVSTKIPGGVIIYN